jgi:hypothetical protein
MVLASWFWLHGSGFTVLASRFWGLHPPVAFMFIWPTIVTGAGADRILVFQDGQIIEEGCHHDLVALGGAYARLNSVAQGL